MGTAQYLRPIALLTSWLLFALPGCSGCGEDPGGEGRDGGVFDDRPVCDRPDGPYTGASALFAAYCDSIDRCNLATGFGLAFRCRQECVQAFDFGASCDLVDDEYDDRSFERRVAPREVIYDEEKGDTCIDWFESTSCDDLRERFSTGELLSFDSDPSEGEPLPGAEECDGVIDTYEPGRDRAPDGTLKVGDSCLHSRECEEGAFCDRPVSSTGAELCSVCAPLPTAGAPCFERDCGAGAWCDTSVDPDLCVALKGASADCQNGLECTSELCFENKCLDPFADGQPCTDSQQCTSRFCWMDACLTRTEEGGPCMQDELCTTNRCYEGACIRMREDGAPCDATPQCRRSCYQGTCIADRDVGEPCDEDANCRWATVCYQNACIQYDRLPEGAPCVNNGDCASNRCLSDFCITPKPNGQPCSDGQECDSRQCFMGSCGLPLGEDCERGDECLSGRCPGHSVCSDPVPDGTPCFYDDACISNNCINQFCSTPREEDESCASSPECVSGLFCVSTSSTCIPKSQTGGPCTVNDGCRYNFCDAVAGLCGHPVGDPCTRDRDCHGYCNGTACQALRAEGEPCNRDEECIDYCNRSRCVTIKPFLAECNSPDECDGGLCEYWNRDTRCRGPGECFEHEDCDPGMRCDEDLTPWVCAPLLADGEDCDEDAECLNYCESRRCVEKKRDGSDCLADVECRGGLCENDRCTQPGLCFSDHQCPEGQFCDSWLTPERCVDLREEGGRCERDHHCLGGWCSPFTDICKTQPKLGDPCEPFECTLDAYCVNGTCRERKPPGASCDESFYDDLECLAPAVCRRGQCESVPLDCRGAPAGSICTMLVACADDAYCDLLDGFTCKTRPHAGQMCEPVPWRVNTCASGSECNSNVCQLYADTGGVCGTQDCNPREAYCSSSSICEPLKYSGELCARDGECIDECNEDSEGIGRCAGPCKMP